MEPPLFPTGGPQVVRAAPGTAASLVVPLPFGSPPIHYKWSRAGASLDDRFITSDDGGGVRLTVSAARTGDSGVYTLQASNAAGKDTTRVRLEVSPDEAPVGDDPPNFLRRLQDLTVKVGTRTRFLVEIVSSTECKVTWYRNERRLMETERVALVRDGNFWCADVAAVSVDDAGRWTCTAENVGGRASCSAHLNVLVPKAYKRPEFVEELRALLTEQGTVSLECKVVGVPTPVLRWFKDSREIKAGDVFALTANADDPTSLGTYTCEAVNCMGRAYSSSKVHVVGRASREGSMRPSSGGLTPDPPPIFTKELEDQFVRICDPLTLSCHIVVPPWPRSVVWYNKEGKIEPSERYHVVEDGVGGYLVEVCAAEWADEGEWKCAASTAGGRVAMSACYVSMDVPKNYRKPRFMENLQAVLTEEGLVSFECKVVGFPTPVLSWFKDGQELKPGDVYQLTGTNSLGSYCCIAKNCMGQASSSAELTVEDIQNQLNEEEKHQLFSKNQAPKFLQGLKSVEAKIDEPFRFTIKVAIPPEPSLLWYRDDQPVDESSRCHHGKEERGVFYLDIQNLEFLDQAEWKCVAMNDFGQSVTSCFLKLIIPRHYKKPRFLENLQAILSDEGAVNLECKVIGVPQPVLKWYKDGEELKPGDIHRIISGQDGTCCLGTYTCEAQNCMGIAASSASLLGFDDSMKVKSKKKSEEQTLQRNLSLSTIHEERTSQMYDTPIGDRTLDDKGEISFSFDGKEVSVSLYETPDLTEEEALQIVEMYADQLSENVTEHNVVELPPLRFVKETSTSGNLLMEAIIIDVSPEYFASPEEDLRTEADIEDISIADENGPLQISLDQDPEISSHDYLEKTMALLSDEKSDLPKKLSRKMSDSQRSGDDYFSLSRDHSLSEEKKYDDTQILSESDLQSFASAKSSAKLKSKPMKSSIEEPHLEIAETTNNKFDKEELEPIITKPDEPAPKVRRRSSRGSRRSSSGSEKSLGKLRDEKDIFTEPPTRKLIADEEYKTKINDDSNSREKSLGKLKDEEDIFTEPPTRKLIADEEYKTKINDVSNSLSKVLNDIQIIERDIILQSELMSSAATASKSLEIIGSLIGPLSEIKSIAEAAKEACYVSPEINNTLFDNIAVSFKVLYQSLTIIEKCVDVESDNKTLVKKTCISLIEKCGNDIQNMVQDINKLISKKYLGVDEAIISQVESLSNEMITIIRFSADTIKARNLLIEASEFKTEVPSLDLQHSRNTQKAIFELKTSLRSLLRIVESTERDNITDACKINSSEIILNDMSVSIQDLQEALEQIESLSIKESNSSLNKYNTEIIETVMDSVLKLRTSFEQLSIEAKKEDNENTLKQALSTVKLNLNEISSYINTFEHKVGKFDILQGENKLEVLQKMAQTLISFENCLPALDILPDVKEHMVTFHKHLTSTLENVIESNESTKYFAFLEICDTISRLNNSIKNMESHDVLSLTSISNTLKIIQDQFVHKVFAPELNCFVLSSIEDIQINLLKNINFATEVSLKGDFDSIQDLQGAKQDELKANVVIQSIEQSIAAINHVMSEECPNELKLAMSPVLENIRPSLENFKENIASLIAAESEKEEHVSELTEESVTETLANPLCELNQNIIVLNQALLENVETLRENSEVSTTYAQPLHELLNMLEIFQHEVISQHGEYISLDVISNKIANVVDNLQSCVLLIQEQSGIETADEVSTLEDLSGIKTTAELIPSDHQVPLTTDEVYIEQSTDKLKVSEPCSMTAQTLQQLNEHAIILHQPNILEFLDVLSECSDHASLKSVAVRLEELNGGIQEILHPILVENINEFSDSLNTSKLMQIAMPMQDLYHSLSVIDASNIPVYENILKIPSEKIHSVIEKLSDFKEHLETCLSALIPDKETTDKKIETLTNMDATKKVCIELKNTILDLEQTSVGLNPEVNSFKYTLSDFLDAIDQKEHIDAEKLKSFLINLNEKLLIVQDDLIQCKSQPCDTITQEIKLIETVHELERNIAVLEQYEYVDLYGAHDIDSCISPQLAQEIQTDSLIQIENLVNKAVNIVQDVDHESRTADLMILEDFFRTCKVEFSMLRCLITKRPSHKKIIRLLQEFNFLRSIIHNFKKKQAELSLSRDIQELLSNFMISLDISMKDIEESLIKVAYSQSKLLFELPLENLNENSKKIIQATKINTEKKIVDFLKVFLQITNDVRPNFDNLQVAIVEELQSTDINIDKTIAFDKSMDMFLNYIEEQISDLNNDDEYKKILENVFSCLQKHQDYRDIVGQSKALMLLKCLSECSTILKQILTDEREQNKQSLVESEVIELKSILGEMVEPLQGLRSQLLSIQEQISSGADEESISIDVTSTESYVHALTEIHNDVIQLLQSEKTIVDETDLSLIEELDKEIHIIQENIQSAETVVAADVTKQIVLPLESIGNTLLIAKEKLGVDKQTKISRDINSNVSSLEYFLNRFIKLETDLLETSELITDIDIKKCLSLAIEINNLLNQRDSSYDIDLANEIRNQKLTELTYMLMKFDWLNTDQFYENRDEVMIEKLKRVFLSAYQLLSELNNNVNNLHGPGPNVTEDKAEALLQHIDQYIEFVEIVEEVSAVIKIDDLLETANIARQLRESMDEVAKSNKENVEIDTRQELLMNRLQRALSELHVQALDSVLEMVPTFEGSKKQHVTEVLALLKADLMAITGIQVVVVAPEVSNEVLRLMESVADIEESKVIPKDSSCEEYHDITCADVVSTQFTVENENVNASIDIEGQESPEFIKLDGTEEKLIATSVEDAPFVMAQNLETKSPTIGTLLEHIDEYICDDVIEIVSQLAAMKDIKELDGATDAAKALRESIISLEVSPLEDVTILHNEISFKQGEPMCHLREALNILEVLTLDNTDELKPLIGRENFDRVIELVQNLRADVNAIVCSDSGLIIDKDQQLEAERRNILQISDSGPAAFKQEELKDFVDKESSLELGTITSKSEIDATEKICEHMSELTKLSDEDKDVSILSEIKEQSDVKGAVFPDDNKSHIKDLNSSELSVTTVPLGAQIDQARDMDNIDSIKKLEILVNEVNNQVDLYATVQDAEFLRNTLDEIQTVIIKLKRDFDGSNNDTLNETLEDLECSVRSVQLQIDENSAPNLLKDACATLQLLVSNMSDIKDHVSHPTSEQTANVILQKCSEQADQTIKLLDEIAKADTGGQMINLISKMNHIKDTLKTLWTSFQGDTDTLINNGIDINQSLDQMEEQIFSLEKETDVVSCEPNVKDSLVIAVHAVYENISNMRSAISSIQKEFMYENYGKPSEKFLHSLKNISIIYEGDNKMNWKHFGKIVRQVLNHFEDIKFYVNLDKTARIPSDAAFTKIILDELTRELKNVVLANVLESQPEMSDEVRKVIKSVEEHKLSLESRSSLEVKEKIPIFKNIADLMLVLTDNLIKYEKEGQSLQKVEALEKQLPSVQIIQETNISDSIISQEQLANIATIESDDKDTFISTVEQDVSDKTDTFTETDDVRFAVEQDKVSIVAKEKCDDITQSIALERNVIEENDSLGNKRDLTSPQEDRIDFESQENILLEGDILQVDYMEAEATKIKAIEQQEIDDQTLTEIKADHFEDQMTGETPSCSYDSNMQIVLTAETEVKTTSHSEEQAQVYQDEMGQDKESRDDTEVTILKDNKPCVKENETETSDVKFEAEERSEKEDAEIKCKEEGNIYQEKEKQCAEEIHWEVKVGEEDNKADAKKIQEIEEEKLGDRVGIEKEKEHATIVHMAEEQQGEEIQLEDKSEVQEEEKDFEMRGKERETLYLEKEKQESEDEQLESKVKLVKGKDAEIQCKEGDTLHLKEESQEAEEMDLQEKGKKEKEQTGAEMERKEKTKDEEKQQKDNAELKLMDKKILRLEEVKHETAEQVQVEETESLDKAAIEKGIKEAETKLQKEDKSHIEKEESKDEKQQLEDKSRLEKEKNEDGQTLLITKSIFEKEKEDVEVKQKGEEILLLEKGKQEAKQKILEDESRFEKEKDDAEIKQIGEETHHLESEKQNSEEKLLEDKLKIEQEKEDAVIKLTVDETLCREKGKQDSDQKLLEDKMRLEKGQEDTEIKLKEEEAFCQDKVRLVNSKKLVEEKVISEEQEEAAETKRKEKETSCLEKENQDAEKKLLEEKGELEKEKKDVEVNRKEKGALHLDTEKQAEQQLLEDKEKLAKEKEDAEIKRKDQEILGLDKEKQGADKMQVEEKLGLEIEKQDAEIKRKEEEVLVVEKEEAKEKQMEEKLGLKKEKIDTEIKPKEVEAPCLDKMQLEVEQKPLEEKALSEKLKEGAVIKSKGEETLRRENEKQEGEQNLLDVKVTSDKEKEEAENKRKEEKTLPQEQESEQKLLKEKLRSEKETKDATIKCNYEESVCLEKETLDADLKQLEEKAKSEKEKEDAEGKRKDEKTPNLEKEKQEAEAQILEDKSRVAKEEEDAEIKRKEEEILGLEKENREAEQKQMEEKTRLEKVKKDAVVKPEDEEALCLDKAKQESKQKVVEEEILRLEKDNQDEQKLLEDKMRLEEDNKDVEIKGKEDDNLRLGNEKQDAELKLLEEKARLEKEKEDAKEKHKEKEALHLEKAEQEAERQSLKEKERLEKEKEDIEIKCMEEKAIRLEKEKHDAEPKLLEEEKRLEKEDSENKRYEEETLRREKDKQDAEQKLLEEKARLEKEKEDSDKKHKEEEAIRLETEKQDTEKKQSEERARLEKEKEDVERKRNEEEAHRLEKEKQEAKQNLLEEKARLENETEDAERKYKEEETLRLEKEKQDAEQNLLEEKARLEKEKEDVERKRKEEEFLQLEKEKQEAEQKLLEEKARLEKEKEDAEIKRKEEEALQLEKEKQDAEEKLLEEKARSEKDVERKQKEEEVLQLEKEKQEAEQKLLEEKARLEKEKEDVERKRKEEEVLQLEKEKQDAEEKLLEEKARSEKDVERKRKEEEVLQLEKEKQEAEQKLLEEKARLEKEKEDAEIKRKEEEALRLEKKKQDAEQKLLEEKARLEKEKEDVERKRKEEEALQLEKEKQDAEQKLLEEKARLEKEKEDVERKRKEDEALQLEKENKDAEVKLLEEKARSEKEKEDIERQRKEEEALQLEKEKQEAEQKLLEEKARLEKEKEDAEIKRKEEEALQLEKEKQDAEQKLLEKKARLEKEKEDVERKRKEEEALQLEKEKQNAEQKLLEEKARLEKEKEDVERKRKEEEALQLEKKNKDAEVKLLEEKARSEKEKEDVERQQKEEEVLQLEKEKQEAEQKLLEEKARLEKEKDVERKRKEEEALKLEKEKQDAEQKLLEEKARLEKEKEGAELKRKEEEARQLEKEKQDAEQKLLEEKARLEKEKEDIERKRKEEEALQLEKEKQDAEEKLLEEKARSQKEKEDVERKRKEEEVLQLEKEKQKAEQKLLEEKARLEKDKEDAEIKSKEEETLQLEKEKQDAEQKLLEEKARLEKDKEDAEIKRKEEEALQLEKEKQDAEQKLLEEKARLKKEKEDAEIKRKEEEALQLEKEKQGAEQKLLEEKARLEKEKEDVERKRKEEETVRLDKEKEDVELKRKEEETVRLEKEKKDVERKRKEEKALQRKKKKQDAEQKLLEEKARLEKEKEDAEIKRKEEEALQLEKEKQGAEQKLLEEKARLEKEKEDVERKRKEEETVRVDKEKEDVELKRKEEETVRLEKEKKDVERKRNEEEALQLEKEKQDAEQKLWEEKARLEKEKEDVEIKRKEEETVRLEKEKEDSERKRKEEEAVLLEKETLVAERNLLGEKARIEKEKEDAEVIRKEQESLRLEREKMEAKKNKLDEGRLEKDKKDAKIERKEEEKISPSQEKYEIKKRQSEEKIKLEKEKESAENKQLQDKVTLDLEIQTKESRLGLKEEEHEKHKKQLSDEEKFHLDRETEKFQTRYPETEKQQIMGKLSYAREERFKEKTKNEQYETERKDDSGHKLNGSMNKYKIGELDISSSHEHKYERKEKPHFINYNNNTNIGLEMFTPPGYVEKSTYESNRLDILDMDTTRNVPPIYKAQTLLYQSQLRSSTPLHCEIGRSSESIEKRSELRQRSKALSETRSVVVEKRSSVLRDHKRKPVFSTYLTDRTAVEASRVKLTCSVLSSTDPTITWFKNGILLDNKLKYKTKFVDGLITLEVLNAVPSDSAEYTCTVQNESGSISTSANLKVYPSFEASPIPPTFTRSIRDTYHLAENELVLESRIRGQPLPTITWLKDDRPLCDDERYQAYYLADGVCRLVINAPVTTDSGRYTCKAENSMWSDQISHVVNFTGKESRLGPNLTTIDRSRFNRQVLESRRPHFTNVLTDYKVTRGGTIGLQVEIKGSPTRVEWLREGNSVTETHRNVRTFVDHGLYTLALSDVTEKESGLYTCRAWSSHGNVDMNAAITVVQPNELEGKPAIIVGRPEKDVLISVGEDLNISFRVQGEPKPKVIFMKGIRDITNSQRVCKMTSDDYVKFTLKRAVVSDAGTYCILARNAYGCDRAFVTVVVRQRASSENLISDWTYTLDDTVVSTAERKYKTVPDRIPSEPSVVDGGNNWVSLAWPKPEHQESAPVLAYKVENWLLGKEGGARWRELGITPLNSFDAFNLKQGEEYHFRVTPRNRYGWGEPVQTTTAIGIGLAGDRPEFTEILPGQLKVLVGETANLSCSFKGKPTPEIVWMKNGHEIEDDNVRIKTLLNGCDCSLTIKDVQIEDEARYSCEASNIHGRASTYARMAVITDRLVWEADAKLKRERSAGIEGEYPPQFTMRLRDRRVQATYPVRLTCQVIGSPAPLVTWFKDGSELHCDSRHNRYQDEHFHTLEVAPTTLEDGGVYEAKARNSSGAVSCRCSLVVDKGIRAYVAPEFCCGLEPLYRLYEGEELRISAMVEAYPSVGVTWYRDGVRLRPSRRAIMTLDHDGQIELALASITRRDAGVYTCTASNEVGQASTSGKVDVIGGDQEEEKTRTPPVVISPDVPYSKEPMFTRKPRSSEAREGDTVIIECEVIGDPKPDVYWLRDFLKPDYYRDASHFKRVDAGPEYRFEIPHAKLDYTGTYSVVARNVHGEAKAIISLQILAKDIDASDDAHNVRYGRVDVIPRFDKELTDLLCYDGDAIEFECRVSGDPEPYIKWLHYNEVIRDCQDFETCYDEGTARLKIKQVTAEDEGTYTCEASNSLGKAKSSACLVVYPPGEPNTLSQRLRRPPALLSAASTPRSTPRATPARSLSRTPGPDPRRLCSPSREIAPKFYTYPFNKVVEEGERVVFKCAVKGLPNPWATWDKDGIILTPTSRITMREKDEILRILEIEEVTIEDVGLYRITVENDYGRAEASARLEVITQKGKFYAGVRSCSASPRRTLYHRRRTPSSSRQD